MSIQPIPDNQWLDFCKLAEVGAMVATMTSNRDPIMAAMGRDMAPVVAAQWALKFPANAGQAKARIEAAMAASGPALWMTLHKRAQAFPDLAAATANAIQETSTQEVRWLNNFGATLPCGQCKTEWQKIINALPVKLTSPDAYFLWTVQAHNMVNRTLGKPELTIEQAKAAVAAWKE